MKISLPTIILETLQSNELKKFTLSVTTWQDEITVVLLDHNHIKQFLHQMRDHEQCQFQVMVDLCGIDYSVYEIKTETTSKSSATNHKHPKRFAVVYHLLSVTLNHRLRIKCFLDDGETIQSISSIYPSAIWYERETWDMYGIKFTDHPDPRRILTEYGFEGHPMRKDFPVFGKVELRYDEKLGKIVHEDVSIAETYREYDFMSEWTGTTYSLPGDEKTRTK